MLGYIGTGQIGQLRPVISFFTFGYKFSVVHEGFLFTVQPPLSGQLFFGHQSEVAAQHNGKYNVGHGIIFGALNEVPKCILIKQTL